MASELAHAVTRYDRKQEGKRGYNHYALGIYLGCVAEIEEQVAEGAELRAAIVAGFSDRLRDYVLKQMGLAPMTESERGAR